MATYSESSSAGFVACYVLILVVSFGPVLCDGTGAFLSMHEGEASEKAFQDDIMNAMGSILGCGGEADPSHVAAIKAVVMPMWRTMPKTNGRIDRRSLRYIVHRYFVQTSSLMIRGFEPSRSINGSHWGNADILSQMVPAYVESVLESKHNSQHGFNEKDVTDMVLTLDQLIFDSESTLLESVYKNQRKPLDQSLSHSGVKQLLEEYLIRWMVDADSKDHAILVQNKTLADEVLPHFHELTLFVEGRIKTLEFERRQSAPKNNAKDMLTMRYSYDEVHKIIGGTTRSFQSYWQSECETMKDALVSMDKHATGRVPLSNFYSTAINSDWRFGESEAYLRELGALDETSKWIGPQVLIPNYLQATSNCIISTAHYLVCCVNECETLLGEIEDAIQAPSALPATLLDLVRNMTSQTTLDHDEGPHLDKHMEAQLAKVAKNNGGMVPLHGRLFAQWLHYVFPRECPFPHKNGAVSAVTPSEYGDTYVASREELEKHASNATDVHLSVEKEELQWMSQWSSDEELMVDYSSEVGRSWTWSLLFLAGSIVLVVGGLYGGVLDKSASKNAGQGASLSLHSHWV